MNTLKTSIVVVLLLGVLYGVYVVLNEPTPEPPDHVVWTDETLQIDMGQPTDLSVSPPEAWTVPSGAGEALSDPQVYTPPEKPAAQAAASLGLPEPVSDTEALPSQMANEAPPSQVANEAPPTEGSSYAAMAAAAADTAEDQPAAEPPAPKDQPPPAGAAEANAAGQQLGKRAYERARKTAESQINKGQYHDALFTLSIFYNSPDLTDQERRELLDLLDPLAGEVIYSDRHHLAPAHKVARGETLEKIAEQYQVPPQLLQNINGIRDARVLVPGAKLKVVPGPFRAVVDVAQSELTLFLGRLYAGRFPISLGQDPTPEEGDYQVQDKQTSRAFFAADGRSIPSEHPDNPYGRVWIDLGNQMCIHGSPERTLRDSEKWGCISLSPIDADDVFGILSRGSNVTIRR